MAKQKSKYFRVSDRTQQLHKLREESVLRGKYCGFNILDEIFTVKRGYPLYIAGAPHAGKTEFTLEILVNLSNLYGWKHFIYLGETGTVDEIIAELCHKKIGKSYRKYRDKDLIDGFAMDEKERMYAEAWVDEHFYILDTEDDLSLVSDFTVSQFYKLVDEVEQETGVTFDTTLIDPFNDVDEELEKYGNREDKFLKDALKLVRRNAKQHNRVNILVNHIADIKPIIDQDTKNRYYPVALPNEWAGGRVWFRRAFMQIVIYRPPSWMKDDEGVPILQNETWVVVQKAKPKGAGKLGTRSIFWDWKKNRYYEMTNDGNRYAQEDLNVITETQEEFFDQD